jgi:hypothetical protein
VTGTHATRRERRQVVVIGAGPSGSIAAALLRRTERDVLVLERQRFPRFSIGESLLVHSLDFLEEAGMMDAVRSAGFQHKNGAAFSHRDCYTSLGFDESSANAGVRFTYQVERAVFDKILAEEAERQGAEIRYGAEIVSVELNGSVHQVTARTADDEWYEIATDFVLDASGFGRTLPRLLDLERPSSFPARHAIFTHITDRITDPRFDRNKILITVHPTHPDVWYWLIPFSGGRMSVGVVGRKEFFASYLGTPAERMQQLIREELRLSGLLENAVWDAPVWEMGGYAANVRSMHGPGFALLGNAAEFLDPVFSSGVTIGMRSASMAAQLLNRQLDGRRVDWETEFERPLRRGVDCFRAYVDAWYDGSFQRVIFSERQPAAIRSKIVSVLAGYAWDESNPFATEARRQLERVSQWVEQ